MTMFTLEVITSVKLHTKLNVFQHELGSTNLLQIVAIIPIRYPKMVRQIANILQIRCYNKYISGNNLISHLRKNDTEKLNFHR